MSTSVAWEYELQSWLEPFLKPLPTPGTPAHVSALCGWADRAWGTARACSRWPLGWRPPTTTSCVTSWRSARGTRRRSRPNSWLRPTGSWAGPTRSVVIDDTALLEKGTQSVGVASQYAGVVGKKANCRKLVSLTLAKGEVPIPLVLRLFLPETWIQDPERLQHAGVPEGFWTQRSSRRSRWRNSSVCCKQA